MSTRPAPRILQIGLGGFGKFHLQAWQALGLLDRLTIAEVNPDRQQAARTLGIPAERLTTDVHGALAHCDVIDIVTGTETHAALCREALEAGKDVFVEKPMTLTTAQARELVELVQRTDRILQVGYYYRVHPIAQWIKAQVARGELGELRYVTGRFLGFKRARTDVGVTHTDAIHFLDLITWLLGSEPSDVFAVTRDHFGRGLEDLSVILLTYPGGLLANVESGYIQPGRWNDRVVPGAKTTKELIVCGSQATIEADFESGTVELFRVHHELRDGVWTLVNGGSERPNLISLGPVDQVRLELEAFLYCVEHRTRPEANVLESGLKLAELMDAIYQSAAQGQRLNLEISVSGSKGTG